MNRIFLLAIFSLIFISCNSFKEKSKITPLFESQKISDTVREKISKKNGFVSPQDDSLLKFRFKIPLGQDIVGHYDYGAITGNEELSQKKLNFIQKFFLNIKHRFYNLGIGLGMMNKVKISTDYEFPTLDPKYIKSIKINRVFFSIDQCSPQDFDCIELAKKNKLTVKMLKSFFVNISVIGPSDNLDFLEDPIKFLTRKEFKKIESLAFDEKRSSKDSFYDVNLARLSTSELDKHINNATSNVNKIFKFKTTTNFVKIKKFFEGEIFNDVVKEVSLVSSTIYVELFSGNDQQKFFKLISDSGFDMMNAGVDVFERCSVFKCVDLKVNTQDLMPIIEKNPYIRFDTYLFLKKLKFGDFKYNGYVELEVVLNLPV